MPEKKSKENKPAVKKINPDKDKEIFAFLAAFLSIIGFVIAILAKREDKYVMFYAKQSLVIFIIGAVAGALSALFSIIPIIGALISFALFIIVFIAWLLSWIHALSGQEKDVPIVGGLARKFDF